MNDLCYIGKHLAMGYGLSIYINHITNCKDCKKRRQAIITVNRLKKAVVRTYTILSSTKIRFL